MKTGFNKTLIPSQLTPLLTHYKINGKMKVKKPRTINGTQCKFINKLSLPETFKMAVALTEGFVTENQAQNKLEYQQAWYLCPLEN